ncbi:TolC family protein [Geobacter sp. AOG1]|uniref:TolC family protein n=1 Tax=Geobacter sp. AOG1 TaxID=1566346 RepID=UPI001CC3A25F|nr:TolC family protein [Geobacter sp. AOG1]
MKNICAGIWLVLILPCGAFAESGRLGLDESIRLALEKNHLLKAALYERKAADRSVSISRGAYLPRVYLEETAAVTNSPTRTFMMKLDEGRFTDRDFLINNLNNPGSYRDFRTAFTLEQPLLDFRIGRALDMARAEDASRSFTLERRRQDVAFLVYGAYLEVQKAKASLAVADQAVRDAREHQRLAQVRTAAGVGLKSDELRTRTFLSEMEQQQITAGNNVLLGKLRLAQATGMETGETIDTTEELGAPVLKYTSQELVQEALATRPDLKELESGTEKASAAVGMARSAYLPTVYGSATYQLNDHDVPFGRDNDSWVVAANLRWDLFDGMRRYNEVGRAQMQLSATAEYLENYRKEVALQVQEAYLRREETGKRLEVARHTVLDAEETVRLVSRRYENALATSVELLDAQTALNRTRVQLVDTESGYALATARLYHAAGIFLKEVAQ